MNKTNLSPGSGLPEWKFIKPLYLVLLFVLGLTGFAQMPIFGRYYVADIPGLGWLGDFYITHYIHYLAAILFLALVSYTAVAYFSPARPKGALTRSAFVRIGLLAAIVATGVIRAFKNFPHVTFPPGFTLFIDIAHLAFMMLFMLFAAWFLATGRGWFRIFYPDSSDPSDPPNP